MDWKIAIPIALVAAVLVLGIVSGGMGTGSFNIASVEAVKEQGVKASPAALQFAENSFKSKLEFLGKEQYNFKKFLAGENGPVLIYYRNFRGGAEWKIVLGSAGGKVLLYREYKSMVPLKAEKSSVIGGKELLPAGTVFEKFVGKRDLLDSVEAAEKARQIEEVAGAVESYGAEEHSLVFVGRELGVSNPYGVSEDIWTVLFFDKAGKLWGIVDLSAGDGTVLGYYIGEEAGKQLEGRELVQGLIAR